MVAVVAGAVAVAVVVFVVGVVVVVGALVAAVCDCCCCCLSLRSVCGQPHWHQEAALGKRESCLGTNTAIIQALRPLCCFIDRS